MQIARFVQNLVCAGVRANTHTHTHTHRNTVIPEIYLSL